MPSVNSTLTHRCAGRRALKIAFSQTKGGVGKSTAAINLAGAARYFNLRVLVIDADPQGSVRDWCQRGGSIETLQAAPRDVPGILRARDLDYDLIVIDTSGSHAAEHILVVETVDVVLCPLENPYVSLKPALTSMARARARGTPSRIFMSRVRTTATERRLARARGIITDFAAREWDWREPIILSSVIRDRVPLEDSVNAGKTAFDSMSTAISAREYAALFRETVTFVQANGKII